MARKGEGFRSAADEVAALSEAQRSDIEEVLFCGERCTELWAAVIQKALDDLAFLGRAEAAHATTRHSAQEIQVIRANAPLDFFESSWFEEVCGYLDVDPDFVREAAGLHRFAA